jgi:hypothetical protein
MSLEDLGNIGEFVAAVAVLLSLIYLAVQIRQNTAALRTSSRQDIVSGYRDQGRLSLEPNTARAYVEGLSRYPDMPFDERNLFGAVLGDHAVFFQSVFALHESGTLEDEIYEAYLAWFSSHLATPGGTAWWADISPILTPRRMVEEVNARLARGDLVDLRSVPLWQLDGPGRTPDA